MKAVIQPSPERFGRAGAHYFLQPPYWLRRHVETLDVQSDREAMRRLTIDLVLPAHPRTWVGERDDGEVLYCLPVTRLTKEEPPAFVDFRSEDGSSLPLLTRDENARISIAALDTALATLLRMPRVDPRLSLSVRELVLESGEAAEYAAGLFQALIATDPQRSQSRPWQRLGRVVAQLQTNELVWLPLVAHPRGRRVVKFCYRIALQRAVVGSEESETENALAPIQKRVAWLTAVMGWDALRYSLKDVHVEGPPSYHLQVHTPGGLSLEESIDVSNVPEDATRIDGEHVYLRGADRSRGVQIRLGFRPARSGLVNLSLLSAISIVGLLWLAVARAEELTGGGNETHAQIAAAVLLIVPALLVGFATLPAASALAATLLTGVRGSAIACGLAAAATAAALAGVRPTASFTFWATIYAAIASIAGIAIAVTWLLTFAAARAAIGVWRWKWIGAGAEDVPALATTAATAAVAGAAGRWLVPTLDEAVAYTIAGALLLVSVAVLTIGIRGSGRRPYISVLCLVAAMVAALATLLALSGTLSSDVREVASAGALITAAAGFLALVFDLLAPMDVDDVQPATA